MRFRPNVFLTFAFMDLFLSQRRSPLVLRLFSVQYAMHLYGYLKEWRKHPHFSFSCCLALVLPFLSLPGDIGGLAGTNITRNQLQTGQMERPTILGAMQDSGAIDISLEEAEQDNDKPMEVQDDNCDAALFKTVKKKTTTIRNVVQDNGGIDATLDDKQGDITSVEAQGDNRQDVENDNKKCHQGTQTELLALFSIVEVWVNESVEESYL